MARAPALGATSQALRRPRIERAPLRIRAASVTAAVNAGTKEFKLWYMVNTNKKGKHDNNKRFIRNRKIHSSTFVIDAPLKTNFFRYVYFLFRQLEFY